MYSGSRLFRHILAGLLLAFFLITKVSHVFAEGSASQSNDLLTVEETEKSVAAVRDLASNLRDNNPSLGRGGGFTWDTERKKQSWTYYNGIMMDAFLMLDPEKYEDYVESFYNAM